MIQYVFSACVYVCSDAVMLLSSRAKTFLELNGKRVAPREKVNCTTTIFSLFNVRTPYSALYCILQKDYPDIVDGLDLHGGRMYSYFYSHVYSHITLVRIV